MRGRSITCVLEGMGVRGFFWRRTIGDEPFIRETESDLNEMRMARALRVDVPVPDLRILSIEDVMAIVVTERGVSIEAMRRQGRKTGLDKAIEIELCYRFTPCTQRHAAAGGKVLWLC